MIHARARVPCSNASCKRGTICSATAAQANSNAAHVPDEHVLGPALAHYGRPHPKSPTPQAATHEHGHLVDKNTHRGDGPSIVASGVTTVNPALRVVVYDTEVYRVS